MEKFAAGYENSLTPNPCIDCSRYLKFGKLLDRARVLGFRYLATGHYARIEKQGERYILKKALDEFRDQSYFLYGMNQEQLSHTLFPLGELRKSEVRQLAREAGLLNTEKPDSQDLCFAPDGDYAAAVERISGRVSPPGPFVSPDGRVLGTHRGVIRCTVGQRRGLGISASEPLYVCGISAKNNTVILGGKKELLRSWVEAGDFRWIPGKAPDRPIRCGVKLRNTQAEIPATAVSAGESMVRVDFDELQRAAAPGQAAVLYDGDTVLGGGVILPSNQTGPKKRRKQ